MTISELKWQDFPHEIPEGTRVRVTDRDNQIYVVKNGQWELEIAWTKCSERMPQENQKTIFRRSDKHNFMFTKNVVDKHSLLFYVKMIDDLEWTHYIPEVWKELNK